MKITPPLPLFDTLQNQVSLQGNHPYVEDYRQANEFIFSYRGSQATFNAYRREVERLLQWSAHIVKKPLPEFKRQDIECFIEFCQQPPTEWIGLKKCDRFIKKDDTRVPNPNWRPFVATVSKAAYREGQKPDKNRYSLSEKALQATFAILGSFFNYLIQEDHIGHNPISQVRQKSKFLRKTTRRPIRRLSELQWAYVIETVEQMAGENTEHERTLFMMNALFAMYLRISELASSDRWQPQMGHFIRDSDGNWWFYTVGKGNKERQVAVSDSMLEALKRYRASRQLPLLPSIGETTPLIPKNKGKGAITSTRQIRDVVQMCFDATIDRLKQDNFIEEASQLQAATVHWLRHTGISEDVKHRPREHVRDDAGHGSSAITDRYIDVELRERHASSKNKRIKPDDLRKPE